MDKKQSKKLYDSVTCEENVRSIISMEFQQVGDNWDAHAKIMLKSGNIEKRRYTLFNNVWKLRKD